MSRSSAAAADTGYTGTVHSGGSAVPSASRHPAPGYMAHGVPANHPGDGLSVLPMTSYSH